LTLQWTTLDVPLGAGIDTKTNEKLLKPPFAADLSDAIFPASGADGYETRPGYDRIRTSTEVDSIDALVTRDEELLVVASNKLYAVTELANNVDLLERGDMLSMAVKQSTLDTKSSNQTLGQVITHGGIRVHCWLDSATSTVQYSVVDATTGSVISENTSLANSTKAKLAKAGNAILVIYYNSSSTSIRATIVPTYAPGSTSDVELRSDAATSGLFDCVEVDSSLQKIFLGFHSSASNTCYGCLVDEAGTVTQANAIGALIPQCLAVCSDGNNLNLAMSNGLRVAIYQNVGGGLTDLSSWTEYLTIRASVIDIAYVAETTPGQAAADRKQYLWLTISAAVDYIEVTEKDGVSAAGTGFATPSYTLYRSTVASGAFLIDNVGYTHVSYDTALQRAYFLVSASGLVHAKCCVTTGYGAAVAGHLPRVIDNTWAPVYREHLELDLDPDEVETIGDVYAQSGLKLVEYNFDAKPSAVQYGRAAYINSGVLWQYDGSVLVEQGFHIYPEGITAVTANGTGSMASSTTYGYRVYYEWTNARGERQRSTTAQVVTAELGASDDTVTLTIPTLIYTAKGDNVSIVVYRTQGDPNIIGGAPLYRVSSPDPSSTGNNAYLANDTTASTVPFVDGLTDAQIRVKELDYRNSGELDNTAPESASVIGESKSRVWLARFENSSTVQYSKLNSRGRDQLEFHDSLLLSVPEEDGAVTAFGSLNFHTVIFKANSCYAVSGEGPNNLRAGYFNLPQVVSLDVGCIEPRSVVSVPGGLLFKSNKGIWQLGHNLDMKYVGAPVEDYNDQDITKATLVPSANHVVFLTSSGRALVYNYLVQQWSTFKNHAGTDSVLWNDEYVYARTSGKLYKQGSSYSDDGVHYSMRFVSAPISVRALQGKQKIRHIRLLGQYYSPHNLRVGLRFNHEPGVSDQGTWDPSDGITISVYGDGAYGAGAYGGDGSPVYQARFNMPRQACQTLQLVIDTTNTSAAGRAMSIQAIQIEVGIERDSGELSVDRAFSATGGSTE